MSILLHSKCTQCVPIFSRIMTDCNNVFIYFRDAIVYATSTFTEGLETVMNILSDGIFKQTIDDEIVRKTAIFCKFVQTNQ